MGSSWQDIHRGSLIQHGLTLILFNLYFTWLNLSCATKRVVRVWCKYFQLELSLCFVIKLIPNIIIQYFLLLLLLYKGMNVLFFFLQREVVKSFDACELHYHQWEEEWRYDCISSQVGTYCISKKQLKVNWL